VTTLRVREYGREGPVVIALHGGPGAPGTMAPVARGLADSFRVLEPMQRGSGPEPLTVARHVADLHEIVSSLGKERPGSGEARPGPGDLPPALVGHSWGAMLALAYAAAHPDRVASLVLIGCGTFDAASCERLRAAREARTDDALRRRLQRLPDEFPDPDARLSALARITLPLYSCDLLSVDPGLEACDARAHQETWEDMLRLQADGTYPRAFAAITAPVLMLHGAFDPHPGRMIRASLEPYLARLEYHEWDRCGHYPWLEKAAREEFFAVLRDWLIRQARRGRQ
jgi:pimeloyl-ACP methyl ester carboxylesterase